MKTTEQMFVRFKNECEYWIQRFGLIGWEVEISVGKCNEDYESDCQVDLEARQAVIRLNEEWDETWDRSDMAVSMAAFHEVAELRYGKLHSLAHYRYLRSHDELQEAFHELIRQDENVIWKKDWYDRNREKES